MEWGFVLILRCSGIARITVPYCEIVADISGHVQCIVDSKIGVAVAETYMFCAHDHVLLQG